MLLLKNVRILDHSGAEDILISDEGKYLEIRPGIAAPSTDGVKVIDAGDMMAAPTFVNTHMHYDKAYTALRGREDSTETLEDSIRIMHDHIRAYTVEDVKARAIRAIRECVMFGTTKLRTSVDISNLDPKLVALQGVLAAKDATKDICDLQVIAFPQEGIYCNEGCEKLMVQAMDMGCDIAGMPPAMSVLRLLGGAGYRVDGIVTDPPYASGASLRDKQQATSQKYTGAKARSPYADFAGDNVDQRNWMQMMTDVLLMGRKISKPGAVCLVFADWRQYPALSDAIQRAGWTWRGVVVWDKTLGTRPQRGRYRQQCEYVLWGSNGPMPVDRPVPCLPGLYTVANVPTGDRHHQTQKPVDLMRALLAIVPKGGHVVDPFCGSGSTLAAAQADGYSATGIELHDTIVHVASRRLDVPVLRIDEGVGPMHKWI